MSVQVVFEGYVCVDCMMLIANGDDSGIEDPVEHRERIEATDLGSMGDVVLACPGDCEGEFRTDPCDYCGSALAGDAHPIAVLA